SRHRQQRPPRGQERQPLFGRQAQRAVEVLGEADPDVAVDDLDLDEAIRRVGREPAQREQLEVALELILRHAEAGRDLGKGGAGRLCDPGYEGEDATVERAGARAHAAPPATASSQETISDRSSGGPTTSAASRSPSTNDRNAAVLVTGNSRTTLPSSPRSTTAPTPTCSTTAAAWEASTRTRAATASSSPYRHGSSRSTAPRSTRPPRPNPPAPPPPTSPST